MFEAGWNCLNVGFTTICTGICGDGLKMSDEFCDDGNHGGCLPNCSGPTPGYNCLGGNPILPDSCYEVCGNDILTPSE